MISVKIDNMTGITVGQRKDGSRAVLWDNDQIAWYSKRSFEDVLWASDISTLAEGA